MGVLGIIIWSGLVLIVLAGRLSYLGQPFDDDGAMFVYMGKVVCEGGRFGRDLCDNKFPTVGLMTSACWRMFGTNWAGYVLLQTGMAAAGALLLGRMAGRHVGGWARWPTAVAGLVYLNFNAAVYGGFQLESMQVFFCILSAGAAMEALAGEDWRDAFSAGLCAGCAAMLKPTALGVVGAFGVALVAGRWGNWRVIIKHGLAATAGVGVVASVALIYLLKTGVMGQMPGLVREIARYAKETPLEGSDFLKPVVVMVLVGFPMVVRGWVCRRDSLEDEEVGRAQPSPRPSPGVLGEGKERRTGEGAIGAVWLFVVAWFCVELAGAVAQRRMYSYHFFPVAAPAALMFGMIRRRWNVLSLVSALGPILILSMMGTAWVMANWRTARLEMSGVLAAKASAGDRLWQDGMPRLLLETNLRAGSRYPLAFLFLNHDSAALEIGAVIVEDLENRRPRWVILPTDLEAHLAHEIREAAPLARRPVRAMNFAMAWRWIEQFTKGHYRPVAHVGRQTLYERAL